MDAGFFCWPSTSLLHTEVEALEAFKRHVSDDPHFVVSNWSNTIENPCNWFGVTCSKSHNEVISIKLSNSSLKGNLAKELSSLSSLKELALDNNLFTGAIPKEISELKNLVVLNLSFNRLSGQVPPEIGNLTSLAKMNLQSNSLSGGIPPELSNLMNLTELLLDRNQFTGHIPGSNRSVYQQDNSGLCQLQKLKLADFSYNFLNGCIPSCFKFTPRSNFRENCFQDTNAILPRSPEECQSAEKQKDNDDKSSGQPKWLLILEIIAGVLLVIFLAICTPFAVKRCIPKSSGINTSRRAANWMGQEASSSIDNQLKKELPKLSRETLELACEGFSNIIRSSPSITIYKGTMKEGSEVAVVSLCIQREQQTNYLDFYFRSELANIARQNHESVTKLLGYCEEIEPYSRMLLFEYASNGTLWEHLHYGDSYHLSWPRRMRIAVGIARGLRYLHTELQPPFAISQFSSNSVYLTEDFSPKLVDFERWRAVISRSQGEDCFMNGHSAYSTSGIQEMRHFDVQANTKAFGILLLELISGRAAYSEETGILVDWAKQYLQQPEKLEDLLDIQFNSVKAEEISVICNAARLCIEPHPWKRPSMQIICAMLEDGLDISAAANLNEPSLAWAELALSSQM